MRRSSHQSNRTAAKASAPTVFTVGHSTRPIEEFIALLQAHGVQQVIDIRTIPRSRHNPQFNFDTLAESLKQAGIGYIQLPGLGGLRRTTAASVNTGWRNASFRGFADYMQTPAFESALEQLLQLARKKPSALMCAEAVPWRCHRSLIADALLVRGILVLDILSRSASQPHKLTPFAKVTEERITYPAEEAILKP